jgi:hypothetical protein
VKKGRMAEKTPSRSQASGGGGQHTRRLEALPHSALRSKEAYPLQRSSRTGCCHTDRPAVSNGSWDPPVIKIVSSPRFLSRESPCSWTGALENESAVSAMGGMGDVSRKRWTCGCRDAPCVQRDCQIRKVQR